MTRATAGSLRELDAEPNLAEQVYHQLIGLLVSGELRPGDVIVERKIADYLKASRTLVREALGRLEPEGLVHKQTNRGVTVSPFSTEAFVDLLNVRQLLEAEASRLAAGRISPERIDAIRAALVALSEKTEPTLAEVWEVDNLLHGEIAAASGNPLLAGMITDLRRRTHVFNAYRAPTAHKFAEDENFVLLEAVASGDGERARAAMVTHIDRVKNAIIDRLSNSR